MCPNLFYVPASHPQLTCNEYCAHEAKEKRNLKFFEFVKKRSKSSYKLKKDDYERRE